ncbi:MAG: PEP-CTERM sorting domain-containing protein [Pseudomonadales bacterium]
MSLLTSYSHAELISSYQYQIRNTLFRAQGEFLNPQPTILKDGSQRSDQGELVSIDARPLNIVVGEDVDAAGGVGPSPTVRLAAQATGRDFRVAAGYEFDSSTCPVRDACFSVLTDAVWGLNWGSRAETRSSDTIVIEAPGFDGLAGEFTLPIAMTGSISVETDMQQALLRTAANFSIATADSDGVRTANTSFGFNAGNRPGNDPARAIDSVTNFVVPFVVGEAFSLSTIFSANAGVLVSSNFLDDLDRILIESDFFNTAHFDPFENFRLDSTGDGLFDTGLDTSLLNISSLLNVDYLAIADDPGGDDPVMPPVGVPEPGTFWLSALGGLALMRMRRRLPSKPSRAIVPVCRKPLIKNPLARLPRCCAAALMVRLMR